jgi:predicted metal-dependent peptidase
MSWQLRIAQARFAAMKQMPYFATALVNLRPRSKPGLRTVGVDAHWRLYVDPDVAEEWSIDQLAGVLLHEVSHLLRDHHRRQPADADVRRWNAAGDLEINDDLHQAGVDMPDGILLPGLLGLEDGRTVEQYYRDLPGHIGAECGSCAAGPERDYEDSGDGDAVSDTSAAHIRRSVASAVRSHRGNTPAGLERWADAVLVEPIDWTRQLATRVRRISAFRSGDTHLRWDRPARRRPPSSFLFPSASKPAPNIAVIIDTSGSISNAELGAALGHIDRIAATFGVLPNIVCCDTAATELKSRSGWPLIGGGGTDLRVAFDYLDEDPRRRPDVIVVFTDGATPWPETAPRAPVIVALPADLAHLVPAWAQTVTVTAVPDLHACVTTKHQVER